VAGTISLALGTALASSIRQDRRVTVSFFGDGATGEGVLYESLNFAGLRKLPIIFACENNLYATHMPIRECRVKQDIFSIAEPFRIASKQVDGNNVLDVYEAGQWAVDCCRKGDGPIFLEFLTYRFRGHVGPDDNIQGCHTDIRPKEEIERWFEKDPIKYFGDFLVSNGLIESPILASIKREVDEEVAEALRFARESGSPNPEELEENIFAVY
jgi:pyruvate dehydrogenase E1 component alpha subunit